MALAHPVSLRVKAMAGLSLVLLPLLGLLLFGLSGSYEMRRTSLLNGLHQTADASALRVRARFSARRGPEGSA